MVRGRRKATVGIDFEGTMRAWKKRSVVLLTACFLTGCGRSGADWPSRPIELVVFSSAGGGTDLAARILAAALEPELGVPIRVSNMTGGRGGAAAQYVFGGGRDAYRWLGASETVLSLAVRGAHPTTSKDWVYFIFAGSPGVISTSANSPYRTFDELLAAVRRREGELTIASSGPGSIWHIRTEILRRHGRFQVRYIPYPGSSESQVAVLAGEVDLVHTALAEQVNYIRGGQLRPLGMVETEPVELDGVGLIPAVTDWLPELEEHLPLPQWLGFMVPAETPEETVAALTRAYHRALESEAVRQFLENTGNRLYGLSGPEAAVMARRLEGIFSWLLYDLGLAQHSPERFGIDRPAARDKREKASAP